jgi:hypothetical protein
MTRTFTIGTFLNNEIIIPCKEITARTVGAVCFILFQKSVSFLAKEHFVVRKTLQLEAYSSTYFLLE